MNLQAALDEFIIDRQSFNRKPSTLHFYRSHLGGLVSFLLTRDVVDVAALNRSQVRSFFAHLSTLELSTCTRAAYDRTLRTFFKFCQAEQWLSEDPMANRPRIRPARPQPDTFTLDEVRQLLETCDSSPLGVRDKAIMLLLLDTGLRAGELVDLVPDRVQFHGDRGLVFIPAGESKGVSDRSVPFWTKTLTALDAWLSIRPPAETIFVASTGRRTLTNRALTPSGLNQLIRRHCLQAHLIGKRRLCHIWRHTFASRYVIAGGDLESLRLLLGHQSLDTVRIYLSFKVHDLVDKHFQLSPVRQLYAEGSLNLP